MEAFKERWGGLTQEAFITALPKGTAEEKALALLALSYSDVPQAQTILSEHLEASEPLERWASALGLGEKKDERALPVLIALLEEFLPPRMHPLEREGGRYHFWRIKAAALLGAWGRGDLAPVLRHALEKVWRIEQADQVDRRHVWHSYQDELVYALGRLEAFGALTGFSLPPSRLHRWLVLLACGSIQAREHYGDLLTQLQVNQELKEKVAQVLEQRFGFSKEEQQSALEHYAAAYFNVWSGANQLTVGLW
jgi:hypothetical protein